MPTSTIALEKLRLIGTCKNAVIPSEWVHGVLFESFVIKGNSLLVILQPLLIQEGLVSACKLIESVVGNDVIRRVY